MTSCNENNGWMLILRLRSNIQLESDLQLAELEVTKLVGCQPEPLSKTAFATLTTAGTLHTADLRRCRTNGVVAYRIQVKELDPHKLFRRLSFVELLVGETVLPATCSDKIVQQFEHVPSAFIRLYLSEQKIRFRLVPFNTAAEWSDIIAKRATNVDEAIKALERTLVLVLEGKTPGRLDVLSERALSARSTTGHLFHGLHVYKAKFFPRMVRALLNVYASGPDAHVLDPYVGSGTALTEASVMGVSSTGLDIDPLSALIAAAKVKLIQEWSEESLNHVFRVKGNLDALQTGQLPLFQVREKPVRYGLIPSFLIRRIPNEVQEEIGEDISLALSAIGNLEMELAVPVKVALSDAISRKFKFRFLGLGYGRFSLNIMPGRIIELFRNNLDYLAKSIAVWRWLREAARLKPARSAVELGDARALPFRDGVFDFVVTSPPYLPASSGRENYLKSKALAMTALGLIRPDQVDSYERIQIGSVHRAHDGLNGLPPSARAIVEWMMADSVRQAKAAATASYFVDLAQSMREIHRVLRSGGRCAMVVARQHTFYRYKSRDVVRIIDNVGAVGELADSCGLEVEATIHVELNKHNAVARPRSLDVYYESILVLKRS